MDSTLDRPTDRRWILRTGAAAGGAMALLSLPGCASLPALSLTEAIRRLLTLSSERALTTLLQPGGFYDSQIARIDLPPQLGGSGGGNILSAILQSGAFRDRLQRELNSAARSGAERAAPFVADTVRTVGIQNASALINGGPQAATELLRGEIGNQLIDVMFPGVADGLRIAENPLVEQALRSATGIDLNGLTQDLTARAADSIWRSIGAEEAAIRANPQSTNDPVLIGVFGGLMR